MGKRSSVERLPEGARKQLEQWLVEFNGGQCSLDEVMSRLESMLKFNGATAAPVPSRSAVHRHAQKFEALAERMRRSQAFADAFAREVGPQVADGKGLQVLLQAFQSLAFDMIGSMEDEQALDPENLMMFAKSLQAAASAQKTDADRALRIQEQTRKEAAAAATREGKAAGLSADQVKKIERAILGVET
jgi:hypothetical protein